MGDDVRSAFEVVNGDALERIRFVVAPKQATPATREQPRLTRSRVFDIALDGVAPGEVLVVTCTNRELREALAADLAFNASRRLGRVLLGTTHTSIEPVVDLLRAHEWQTSLPRVRVGTRGRQRPASYLDAVSLQTRIRADSVGDGAGKLIVACDVDDGAEPIAAWRDIAQRRAVPVVVFVSGRVEGWADPEDAHIDLFRTHYGAHLRFIARGVPARSPESRRFAVVFDPIWGRVKTRAMSPLLDGVIERCRWAPEVGFDGVYRARPTLMTNAELAAILADEDWIPDTEQHALRVLEVVVAVMFQAAGDSSEFGAVSDERKRALTAKCGGIDAFREMYEAVSRELAGARWADDDADHTDAPPWSGQRMTKMLETALAAQREAPPERTYDLEALRRAMRGDAGRSLMAHGASGKTSTMIAPVLSALDDVEPDDDDR